MKRAHALLVTASLSLCSLVAAAAPPDRVARGAVVVGAGEQVADAVAFGGDVTVSGWVTGDAVAFGGSVRLLPGARVEGDVTALGGTVVVEPGAFVAGDQVALGGAVAQAGAHLAGPAVAPAPRGPVGRAVHRAGDRVSRLLDRVAHLAGCYVLIVLLGLVMLGVAPQRTRALAAAVAAYPGRSLGFGLLTVLGVGAAVVLLSVTMVGIPAAAVIAAAACCAAVLGLTGVSILIGELVPAKRLRDRPVSKLLVGAGVLVGALALPFAGPVLGVLAVVLGLGALAGTRMRPGHVVFATGAGPYRSAVSP